MAGDLLIATINGEDITKGFNPILAQYTVAGSAVTSIDFSGLDINAHGGSYEIEVRWNNPTSTSSISLYINNDLVASNYSGERLFTSTPTTVSSAATANPELAINDGGNAISTATISNVNSFARWIVHGQRGVNSIYVGSYSKTATVANITQLTFTASVALSIGIGSKIIIRRKDK